MPTMAHGHVTAHKLETVFKKMLELETQIWDLLSMPDTEYNNRMHGDKYNYESSVSPQPQNIYKILGILSFKLSIVTSPRAARTPPFRNLSLMQHLHSRLCNTAWALTESNPVKLAKALQT